MNRITTAVLLISAAFGLAACDLNNPGAQPYQPGHAAALPEAGPPPSGDGLQPLYARPYRPFSVDELRPLPAKPYRPFSVDELRPLPAKPYRPNPANPTRLR